MGPWQDNDLSGTPDTRAFGPSADIHRECRYVVKEYRINNWYGLESGIFHQALAEKGKVEPGERADAGRPAGLILPIALRHSRDIDGLSS